MSDNMQMCYHGTIGKIKDLQLNKHMNIQLTPELEQFVQSTVYSGRYSDASEVVRTALRLLEEREMERLVRLEELRKEIAIGIACSDRGEVFDGEEVLRELRQEIEQERQDKA